MIFNSPSSSSFASSEIADTSFAPLVSHVVGLPTRVEDAAADRASFPATSMFNRPAANFLLVVEGVSSSMLNEYAARLSFVASRPVLCFVFSTRPSHPLHPCSLVCTVL